MLIFSFRDGDLDRDAKFLYNVKMPRYKFGAGDGHIAVNPTYSELLLIADHETQSLFTLNVTDGEY